jgi:hypothetical protein
MRINELTIMDELTHIRSSADSLLGKSASLLLSGDHNGRMVYYQISYQVDQITKEFNWILPHINQWLAEAGFDFKIEQIKEIDQQWEDLEKNHIG